MRADIALRRAAAPLALSVCTGPLERARGLLGKAEPAPGTALWIKPCRAIHTWAMRYPIDVVFLDARGLVLRVAPAVPPYRVVTHGQASSVLELRSGECERLRVRAGERLALPAPAARPSRGGREPETRPALVVTLALVLAMAWMLGGCTSTPTPRDVPAGMARSSAPVALPYDELALAAELEYGSRAWSAAEAAYVELARRRPAEGEHWYRLGVIYLHTARPDAAARALEIAAQLGARPGSVHQSLAAARLAQAAHALRLARATLRAEPRVERRTTSESSPASTSGIGADGMAPLIEAVERLLPESLVAATAAADLGGVR